MFPMMRHFQLNGIIQCDVKRIIVINGFGFQTGQKSFLQGFTITYPFMMAGPWWPWWPWCWNWRAYLMVKLAPSFCFLYSATAFAFSFRTFHQIVIIDACQSVDSTRFCALSNLAECHFWPLVRWASAVRRRLWGRWANCIY